MTMIGTIWTAKACGSCARRSSGCSIAKTGGVLSFDDHSGHPLLLGLLERPVTSLQPEAGIFVYWDGLAILNVLSQDMARVLQPFTSINEFPAGPVQLLVAEVAGSVSWYWRPRNRFPTLVSRLFEWFLMFLSVFVVELCLGAVTVDFVRQERGLDSGITS